MIGILKFTLVIAAISLLLSCVDAAVTGVQVAYNHDRIQKTVGDQYITTQAYRKIYRDTNKYDDSNVTIATFHKEVLLAGQVASKKERQEIEGLVKQIPETQKVYNLTEISPPTGAITRMSDVWITTKIKSKLIAMNDVDPDQIKVVTENGTVFLMGMVLADQADIAVDVARNTDGVQNVIKLFTYLRISKS